MKYLIILVVLLLSSCSFDKEVEKDFQVGYNVFPISFADSNDDGIGDINGITAKLDYLQELGIDTIWLNPIHKSDSYHKYDVIDYYTIDDDFGTIKDFENFINEAHDRNIKVIMDFVINHTSSKHKWFIDAKNDKDSPYRDYYRFYDFQDGFNTYSTKDGWTQIAEDEYYFSSFWSEMPELNFENPKVTEEIYNIADFWLEKGVDGFRIDAVKHLYDPREYPKGEPTLKYNVKWFEDFREYLSSKNADVFVIGEVYDKYQSVSPYYQSIDYLFNFSVAEQILNSSKSATNKDFNKTVEKSIKSMNKYSTDQSGVQANFISNHDQNRAMSVFDGDVEKAKLASNILFTLPGMPWIYYGEELGMLGEGKDEYKREPMDWGDEYNTSWEDIKYNKDTENVLEQIDDEKSLYNTYKELIAFRKENELLQNGTFEAIETDNEILSYKVYDDSLTLIITHNLSDKAININIDGDVIYTNGFDNNNSTLYPYKSIVVKGN